jgi:hypothetical protein
MWVGPAVVVWVPHQPSLIWVFFTWLALLHSIIKIVVVAVVVILQPFFPLLLLKFQPKLSVKAIANYLKPRAKSMAKVSCGKLNVNVTVKVEVKVNTQMGKKPKMELRVKVVDVVVVEVEVEVVIVEVVEMGLSGGGV